MTRPYPTEKSLANLRPFNKMSDAERKKMNSNGGKKGAESKRCAEVLKLLLDKVYKDKNGAKADGREVLMVSLFNNAVKHLNVPATRLILELLGEMPKQTQEFSIKTNKDENDNGMLDGLLQANLEIQKKVMEGKENGQTRTESADADSELA